MWPPIEWPSVDALPNWFPTPRLPRRELETGRNRIPPKSGARYGRLPLLRRLGRQTHRPRSEPTRHSRSCSSAHLARSGSLPAVARRLTQARACYRPPRLRPPAFRLSAMISRKDRSIFPIRRRAALRNHWRRRCPPELFRSRNREARPTSVRPRRRTAFLRAGWNLSGCRRVQRTSSGRDWRPPELRSVKSSATPFARMPAGRCTGQESTLAWIWSQRCLRRLQEWRRAAGKKDR